MSMNGEVQRLIAEWVKLTDRVVKLQAKADNIKQELANKGVNL